MGRFRDLWASGKFVLKARNAEDQFQQAEALRHFSELSPELPVSEGSLEIVGALKSRRGIETGRWLREMAPQAQVPEESLQPSDADCFADTVACMDVLFGEFSDL